MQDEPRWGGSFCVVLCNPPEPASIHPWSHSTYSCAYFSRNQLELPQNVNAFGGAGGYRPRNQEFTFLANRKLGGRVHAK